MSLINKNNYEAFLLDYMEQNLSADMVAELMLFFEMNPELKVDLDDIELTPFSAEEIVFSEKSNLKKEAIENLMISEIEGLNTTSESQELQEILKKDDDKKKAFLLYKKSILKEPSIVFPHKENLKKESKIIPLFWWASSVAAILIAVFMFRGLVNTETHKNQNNFASNKEEIKTTTDSINNTIIVDQIEKENPIEESLIAEEKKQEHKIISSPKKDRLEPENKVIEEIIEENSIAIVEELEEDSILIMPTIVEEDNLLANADEQLKTNEKEPLNIGQFLKKEAQKKVLNEENPEPNQKTELMVVDLLAKVAGKNARVDKSLNKENEVEEYALNIGGFSFSKKVRK